MQTTLVSQAKSSLSTFDKVDRGAFFAVRFSYLNSVEVKPGAFSGERGEHFLKLYIIFREKFPTEY